MSFRELQCASMYGIIQYQFASVYTIYIAIQSNKYKLVLWQWEFEAFN